MCSVSDGGREACGKIAGIRLLFIVRSLGRGGAERQLIDLLRRLDKTALDITLVCLYPGGALWDEAQAIPNIRIRHFARRGRWDFRVIPALWRYMRDIKPDVVHGYMDVANVLALLGKLMGAKVVWGIRRSKMDLSHYDYFHRVAFWTESVLSRFADLIICNSHRAIEELGPLGFPIDRMVVIPNGIDLQRFRMDSEARLLVRAEWGVGSEEFLIGLVARIDPIKGHSVFLRAARQVAIRHPEVRFVLVGGGQEALLQTLREQAEHLELGNRLIWAGERSDMSAVLCTLDLVVSASFSEGFSNVLGESMACGVPCVATNVGDCARIIGGKGWLAEPGDPDGLAEQICSALRLHRNGGFPHSEIRLHIERCFNMDKLVETTAATLYSVVRDGHKPRQVVNSESARQ